MGPVKRRDVDFVDRLATSGAKGAEEAAVETLLEAHDGEVWRTWSGIPHDTIELFGAKFSALAPLPAAVVHESGLVCEFVGIGACQCGEDLIKARGCNREDAIPKNFGIIARGEVTDSGTVDDGVYHLVGLCSCSESRVVVPQRDGRDLRVTKRDVTC